MTSCANGTGREVIADTPPFDFRPIGLLPRTSPALCSALRRPLSAPMSC